MSFLRKLCVLAAITQACTFTHADVVVGAPFDLSGPVAEHAKFMRRGAELAEQQVNSQGGVLEQRYKLAFADTACDAEKGVEVVRQLIESGAIALVGPICSAVTLRQARSVSIPAGVVTLSVASASSLITQLNDQDLVFRTAPSDAVKGRAMAQQAWNMGIQRIAISHASDAYNISVSQVFAEHFKALGGRVVINQVHQPKQASYLAEARAVAAGAPDVAVFSYSSAGGVQFLKDLLSLEGVRHALGTDGLMANELATTLSVAELQRVTFVLAAADTEREGYKRWMAMARAAGLKPDGSYVAHAYDAAFLMALAIEASGGADKTKVSAGLRAISGPGGTFIYPGEFAKAKALIKKGLRINYDGASGPVDFDAAGDIAGRASINWFSNGAWHAVLLK